jgi:hypothetical protein
MRRVWLATVAATVAVLCASAVVYVLETASPDDLGVESGNNAAVTLSLFIGWACAVVAVVAWARVGTAPGMVTPPRRVAVVTGIVWFTVAVALGAATLLGRSQLGEAGLPRLASLLVVYAAVVALPAVLWLPIWVVVAAFRARRPARARVSPWITEP